MRCLLGSKRTATGTWRLGFCGAEQCCTHSRQPMVLQLPVRGQRPNRVPRLSKDLDLSYGFDVNEGLPRMKCDSLRANISETGLVLLINEQKGEKEEIRDEREFSWCCSFPWGFGCRGTKRRLASWRAAAECSGSQSGRRSGAGFAAGSRSSCQSEAADLHSGVPTTHLTRSRS